METFIRIKGARENNLKNISLEIPKHQLVIVTGPSGSGKSTLAMDILQRECQRQYMESSGNSAESISKPKVDSITGLSPSISVGQHITNRNPRSTVGTVTDMYTYLRFIFEKQGTRICQNCANPIPPKALGEHAENIHCPACGHAQPSLTKSNFSFNSPAGACPACSGLGTIVEIDIESVFDFERTIRDGAVKVWYDSVSEYYASILDASSKHYSLEMDKPLHLFTDAEKALLYYGVESDEFKQHFPEVKPPKTAGKGNFKGVLASMWQRYKEKDGQSSEAACFRTKPCRECSGDRLNEESRKVTVIGKTLPELSKQSLYDLSDWVASLQQTIVSDTDELMETLTHDLHTKIRRILDVGLGYLTIDRQAVTLSGGEAQRLRLASILGSGLTGVLYILDEPTSGLHPKDTDGLIKVLKELRDLGNTVLLIEHDDRVMRAADHIIDIGPGAGRFGGEVTGQGTAEQLTGQPASVTGNYLKSHTRLSSKKRNGNGNFITINSASLHNLKNITASFPLGCLTAVSGVSGSGKSSLVFDLLASAGNAPDQIEGCERIEGLKWIDKIITVDQTPVSRMQRSNVATYADLFTHLRKIFASLPQAKEQGLKEKHFSFNTPGGRCEKCEGLGKVAVEMHFLSGLEVTCPECRGKRYKEEILAVTLNGYTISDLLELSIEESRELFPRNKKMTALLNLLCEVGIGYLQWGQSVTTLSGGEAQRLKLAKELSKQSSGHTLYLLDEPSTGLHPADVEKLLILLKKLVDAGHSVIMVEHNTDLIAASDWVIDMGPGGGEEGGTVVAAGSPDELANSQESITGKFLQIG